MMVIIVGTYFAACFFAAGVVFLQFAEGRLGWWLARTAVGGLGIAVGALWGAIAVLADGWFFIATELVCVVLIVWLGHRVYCLAQADRKREL